MMRNILTTKPFYIYPSILPEYFYFFRWIVKKSKRRFDSLAWDKYINSAWKPVCVLKAEFRRGCCERHIPSGCRRLTCRWACSYQFQRLVAAKRWERCGGSLRWLSGSEAYPSLQQEGRSQLRYWGAGGEKGFCIDRKKLQSFFRFDTKQNQVLQILMQYRSVTHLREGKWL